MMTERGERDQQEEIFEASKGSINRFKAGLNLHTITVQEEAASTNTADAEIYPAELANFIE